VPLGQGGSRTPTASRPTGFASGRFVPLDHPRQELAHGHLTVFLATILGSPALVMSVLYWY
jgi:hypothetical protein